MKTAWLLAWRSLSDRPWRAALLFLGYGVGVAVMIVLLSVGEALLSEARDRDLASGGDLVLLPEGVDPAVLKVNGVTGLYFTIPHTQFLVRDVLLGPRFGGDVVAAAPQIQGRVVYIRTQGRVIPATASAGIPLFDSAAHATAAVPGATDSPADHLWIAPAPEAAFDRLDHFHRPRAGQSATWAEWDYFNFVDPATGAAGYVTLLAGGEGRGVVVVRLRRPDRTVEDLALPSVIHEGDLSFTSAAQRIGPARVGIEGGRYHIVVADPQVHADLWIAPAPGLYLPAGESDQEDLVSGYVVPVVRGRVRGEIHTARTSLRLADAIAYHDHNWGTWRGVTWEWGEASSAHGAVLYGALHFSSPPVPESVTRPPVLFLWASPEGQRGGFMGVFVVRSITYAGWHPGPTIAGRRVAAPAEVTLDAGQGDGSVLLHLRVDEALGSRVSTSGPAVFLQLRGTAELTATIDGRSFTWTGPGAAETFVPLPAAPTPGRVTP
jgi:hypothetical protein